MSKEYEEIRKKIAKQYNEKINALEKEVKALREENASLKRQSEMLKKDLLNKEDYIFQLEKCVDLPKEDLLRIVESEKSREKIAELFHSMETAMSLY